MRTVSTFYLSVTALLVATPILQAAQPPTLTAALSDSPSSAPTADSTAGPTWNYTSVFLSSPRANLATAATSRYAFFAGGEDKDSEPQLTVDIYDNESGSWSQTQLSKARRTITGGSLADRYVLFAGGLELGTGAFSSVVDIYDTQSQKWLDPVTLSVPRANLVALNVNDTLLFIGGHGDRSQEAEAQGVTGGMVPSNVIDMVNRDLKWSSAVLDNSTAPPALSYNPAAGAASQSNTGVGVLAGGYYFDNPTEIRPVQHVDNRTWIFTADRVEGFTRENMQAIDVNSNTPAAPRTEGGEQGEEQSQRADLFIAGPALNEPVLDAAGALVDNKFIYAGGRISPQSTLSNGNGNLAAGSPSSAGAAAAHKGSNFVDKVAILTIPSDAADSSTWAQTGNGDSANQEDHLVLSEARSQIAVAVVSGTGQGSSNDDKAQYVLLGGGLTDDAYGLVTKTIDVYDVAANRFVNQDQHLGFHIPRAGASAVVVGGCKALFAGGWIMGMQNATAAVDIFDIC
ncbi:hypothetical protein IWQ60_001085 [Tieghemiomyces parasiticus]|uniref:Galactose oxidase n=1 Tax=Tieghemiomyces parasiticus TaxID=78921 RepID=A0A9W8DYL9_9FUNG|nr:hypothetical protein IWQ60_001085 [Tieghemiomyces parasiticus]